MKIIPKCLKYIVLFSTLSVIFADTAPAQWEQTSGPKGPGTLSSWLPGNVSSDGLNIPAITINGQIFSVGAGLFRSTDTGQTWSEVDTGFTSRGLATVSGNLFSCSGGNVFRSTNSGQTRDRIDSTGELIYQILNNGGDLFMSKGGNVYRSSDLGASWDSVVSIVYLSATSDKVFASNSSEAYETTNLGNSWSPLSVDGYDVSGAEVAANGSSILVFTQDGGYLSTNDGGSWTLGSGLPQGGGASYIWSVITLGNVSLAASFQSDVADNYPATLYRTTNAGTSWSVVDTSVGKLEIANFHSVGGKVFATTSDGFFESDDTGIHWKLSIYDEVPLNVYSLVVVGGKIVAGTGGNASLVYLRGGQGLVGGAGSEGTGIFVTMNDGSTWGQGGLAYRKAFCLLSSSTYLFAGTDRGTADTEGGIFRSSDTGASWTRVANGFTNVNALGVSGSNLFAGTDSGIYLSTNNGTNWKAVFQHVHVNALATQGSKVFAGTSANGLIVSTNNGTSWSASNGTLPISDVQSLAVKGGILFAGTNGNGLFLSKDTGISWTDVSSGLPASSITALEENNAQFFAGTAGGGIYRTDDSGATWEQVDSALTDPNITSLAIRNGNLFAGTIGGGVWERPLSQMLIAAPGSVNQQAKNAENISAYPNPFTQSTTITFTTDVAGYADVSVVNLLGAEVAHLFSGELAAGNHSFTWDAERMSAPRGMYECLVRMNGRVESMPMVLIQ